MPYTTNVNFLPLAGGSTVPAVIARLWKIWDGHELAQEDQSPPASTRPNLMFSQGPNYPDPSGVDRHIGISIQGIGATGTDLFFRSDELYSLPNLPIEVVYDDRPTLIPVDQLIPWMLPPGPFPVVNGTIVTQLTARLVPAGINFAASGTIDVPVNEKLGFRYTGIFNLTPSSNIIGAKNQAIDVAVSNEILTFTRGHISTAFIEGDLKRNLRSYFLGTLGPQLGTNIGRRVNTAIFSAAGRQLPDGILPPDAILSIRRIDITTTNISVKGAIGAFDGVFSKFSQMKKIIVGLGGKCVDIRGAVNQNGTPIILYSRHNGLNQQWELTADRFLVSPLDPNKCLGVQGLVPNNGTPIILWDKDGGPNQKWTHNADGTLTCDLHPNKCIDVRGGIDKDETPLILWDKHGGDNQKWHFVDLN